MAEINFTFKHPPKNTSFSSLSHAILFLSLLHVTLSQTPFCLMPSLSLTRHLPLHGTSLSTFKLMLRVKYKDWYVTSNNITFPVAFGGVIVFVLAVVDFGGFIEA